MSQTRSRETAGRWLLTAEEDLRAAVVMREARLFAHACFMAQQCGEKAVKALWYLLGEDPWGHSIQKLVMQFPAYAHLREPEGWIGKAAQLDRFYIPTRYPNGLPDLTPEQSYFLEDADQALALARDLLAWCHDWVDLYPPTGWLEAQDTGD